MLSYPLSLLPGLWVPIAEDDTAKWIFFFSRHFQIELQINPSCHRWICKFCIWRSFSYFSPSPRTQICFFKECGNSSSSSVCLPSQRRPFHFDDADKMWPCVSLAWKLPTRWSCFKQKSNFSLTFYKFSVFFFSFNIVYVKSMFNTFLY